MQLILTPSDIIKRCLWSNYKNNILYDKNEEEIRKMLEEDKPTVISEQDAYVIGLLKIVETDNLIHRFNQHINEILQLNSIMSENSLLIKKPIITKEINNYKQRFPQNIKLSPNYERAIVDVLEYIDNIKISLEKQDIIILTKQDKSFDCYDSKKIKKLLDN